MSTRASCLLPLLAAAVTLLPGCLPGRVSIDLAPRPDGLAETKVISDDGSVNGSPKVALIDVDGTLSHAAGGGLIAGRTNSVDDLVSRLTKAEEDKKVRAVVLRVNSPGGTVAASETMYHEIKAFRERSKKPVVVSMAEVAASGGYYISMAADKVVAQETTITGSIGVIFQTFNMSKGMAMIGIEGRALTSGKNKDMASPFAPIREEQYAVLQKLVDEFYGEFKGLVLARRAALAASGDGAITAATDGRVFTGKQALEAGLVDQLGGLRDAYAEAKKLAGISTARLVKYHASEDKPLSPYATSQAGAIPDAAASGSRDINLLTLRLGGDAARSQFLYLWDPQSP